MSLATRLSAFFLAALGVALLGFSGALYALASHHLYRQLDERLDAALGTLEAAVDVEHDGLEWEPYERRLTLGTESGVEDVRWSVRDDRGRLVDRSENAAGGDFPAAWTPPAWPTDPPDGTVFGRAPGWRLAGRQLRLDDLLRLGRAHPEDDEDDKDVEYPVLVLTAGLSPAPVEAGLRSLGLTLAVLSTALWLTAAALGRRLCRRALAPLARMAASAREMTAAGLGEPLPNPGTRDELEDLGRAFNELLARLHESFERQARFTGDASHQLRTPLAGMLSLVEVVRRRRRPPEEYEQTLDQVQREATRLSRIVEALLFLARAEAESEPPKMGVVDLADFVPEQLRRWSSHPRAADIVSEGDDIPCPVRADSSLLAQMLDNLLDNACKYSEPGTPIVVRAWRGPGAVFLSVEDQGHGLSAEEQARVFEPFYRAPQARLLGRTGVGLGLSMVRRIIDTFGGSIDVESRTGLGSRFTLRFPAAEPAPRGPQEALTADHSKWAAETDDW